MFCDAYGLKKKDRVDLVDLMIERLEHLIDFLLKSARQGHIKYQHNMKDGHHLKYRTDIKYIKLYKSTIQHEMLFNK